MNSSLGHILLIANPAAQSGAGAAAADKAAANLRAALGEDAVTVARTAGPRHACAIAEGAQGGRMLETPAELYQALFGEEMKER